MPWKEATTMSVREEFVAQALEEEVNMSELCRTYGIDHVPSWGDISLKDFKDAVFYPYKTGENTRCNCVYSGCVHNFPCLYCRIVVVDVYYLFT